MVASGKLQLLIEHNFPSLLFAPVHLFLGNVAGIKFRMCVYFLKQTHFFPFVSVFSVWTLSKNHVFMLNSGKYRLRWICKSLHLSLLILYTTSGLGIGSETLISLRSLVLCIDCIMKTFGTTELWLDSILTSRFSYSMYDR